MSNFNISWDASVDKKYETGVNRGVLYPLSNGTYPTGYAWNGLSAVNESPSGAEATAIYADDIKYLNLVSAEEFGATVEAYTYPDEFAECDGSADLIEGMTIGQQNRKKFGLCYRTTLGNDDQGNAYGYKIHIIYGCVASPSAKNYSTINDSPEAITFSWEIKTTPVPIGTISGVEYKPTATVVLDSTKISSTKMASIETILYGKAASDGQEAVAARLPLPAEILSILNAA